MPDFYDNSIHLGSDFPITDKHRHQRERIADALANALHCIKYDPIGGNARHEIERALSIMDEGDD